MPVPARVSLVTLGVANVARGSFALADEHLAWIRQVRGQALLQRLDVPGDVIRAPVQAMVGSDWKTLRDDLDARQRPRGRALGGTVR
jgi:hypothetical protein